MLEEAKGLPAPHVQDMFCLSCEQPDLTKNGLSLPIESTSDNCGGEAPTVSKIPRDGGSVRAVFFMQQLQHVASMGQNPLPVFSDEELHKMQTSDACLGQRPSSRESS